MPLILAFERQRQEDCEFKTSLGYKVRPCLQKQNNSQTKPQIIIIYRK
jgi:hypothetical protein